VVLKEFRDFILRGNVVDLAVAVVIGAAFKGIVDALVKDLVTPLTRAARQAATGTPPAPTKEEVLLTEIRDALRAQNGTR